MLVGKDNQPIAQTTYISPAMGNAVIEYGCTFPSHVYYPGCFIDTHELMKWAMLKVRKYGKKSADAPPTRYKNELVKAIRKGIRTTKHMGLLLKRHEVNGDDGIEVRMTFTIEDYERNEIKISANRLYGNLNTTPQDQAEQLIMPGLANMIIECGHKCVTAETKANNDMAGACVQIPNLLLKRWIYALGRPHRVDENDV